MVSFCSIGNMLDNSTLEDSPCFETLANQPGQIYGSIDTNGREFLGIIDPGGEFFIRDWFEL